MKSVVLAVVLAIVAVIINAESAFDPVIMKEVNNGNNLWKAGINKFAAYSVEEVKAMLKAKVPQYERYTKKQMEIIAQKAVPSNNPSSFDARKQWPTCIHPIRNQEQCGSCWAFGASEALSDRFCIASQGKVNVVLSPQDAVSCDYSDMGCNGGNLDNVWSYMQNYGLVPDACFPYVSGNGTEPGCPTTCVDGKTPLSSQKYKLKSYEKVSPSLFFWERESKIESALISTGPVESGFSVYQDFIQYQSGVYHHVTGGLLGGHAIKIIGYGVTSDNVKYWIVANSWGTSWGLDGFFWIKKGNNECGIEADAYAGEPDLSNVPAPYNN